jgi:hypothetical protein
MLKAQPVEIALIKRFSNPHECPAGLELGSHDLKTELVLKARGEFCQSGTSPPHRCAIAELDFPGE